MPGTPFYNWFGLNQTLFFAINGIHSVYLDQLMLLGSRLGDFWNLPWIIGALILMLAVRTVASGTDHIRWLPERKTILRLLLTLLAGYVLAAILVTLLKLWLHMPRPSAAITLATVHVLGEPESIYSFPSGHAAFVMLLTVVFWPHCRNLPRALLILFAVWVGVSRINIGAHFPADVIAGYLCGAFSGWIATRVLPPHPDGRLWRC
ncbi:MAG: phosphatase PAP2 family protein [Deltaproteobacteria bacterium]|nr:phosphatase PAP2 family protein [Deltaproteobacteria bacterium]